MTADAVLFGLLHLLVFAWWLGGDLGVFYASFLLTDEKRSPEARLAAGKILNDVDLAPRMALLLALPTGLALADAKGWLALSALWVALAFAVAFAWIALVCRLHAAHGAGPLRAIDFGLRLVFLAALSLCGIGALLGVVAAPSFIALKLLILAFCVAMGLCVRIALKPFGPAYAQLAAGGGDARARDRAIRQSLERARPFVMMIWLSLVAAAILGLATPA